MSRTIITGRDGETSPAPVAPKVPCTLVSGDPNEVIADLMQLNLITPEQVVKLKEYAVFTHVQKGARDLNVIRNVETYDLDQAAFYHFGIRKWRHVSVSVVGALKVRLDDQRKIGRQRAPGERSPAPLPDWYELNHLAYEHWTELGFDPSAPVFQLLPPPTAAYLNIAEALHLRQPA